jgi:hypothetical protein
MALDGNFFYLSPFYRSQEIAEGYFFLRRPGLAEKVEEEDHHQADDQPKG